MKPETKKTIDHYVELGFDPGSFVRAVLENNLKEAFGCADAQNREDLFEIVSYCYNYIPDYCWGSREKVTAWLASFRNKKND